MTLIRRPTALTKTHNLSGFDCETQSLSEWLKKYALQSDQSGHTKTMVITADEVRVTGYYSFSIVSMEHEDPSTLPRAKKGLARYPIPILLIARLAVDKQFQGQALGKRLLRHALKRAVLLAANEIPLRAVVVDAIDEDAKRYYSGFDFMRWPMDSLRMWVLMKDLVKTLESPVNEPR